MLVRTGCALGPQKLRGEPEAQEAGPVQRKAVASPVLAGALGVSEKVTLPDPAWRRTGQQCCGNQDLRMLQGAPPRGQPLVLRAASWGGCCQPGRPFVGTLICQPELGRPSLCQHCGLAGLPAGRGWGSHRAGPWSHLPTCSAPGSQP